MTIKHKHLPNVKGADYLYSIFKKYLTVIVKDSNILIKRLTGRIQRLFVPRFYYDRINTNFLKGLKYIGEKTIINEKGFYEFNEIGRKLYEYRRNANGYFIGDFTLQDLDWSFPEKFFNSVKYTVHGFTFTLNAANKIKRILNPSNSLINAEDNTETMQDILSDEIFYHVTKYIKEKIVEYNVIPTKNVINDKSNLIKKTFVSAINKQLSLYGSFSYFSGKSTISNLKLLTSSNFLKFLVEKNSSKSNLKLQLAQIDGSEVKASDNKIHYFSTTKLRKKKGV